MPVQPFGKDFHYILPNSLHPYLFLVYRLLLASKALLTWVRTDKQTYIHTYMQTTHTYKQLGLAMKKSTFSVSPPTLGD